jgi:hypothetical protein
MQRNGISRLTQNGTIKALGEIKKNHDLGELVLGINQ